ncbi:MAG: hypothetical protein AAB152_18240 [Candidatus Coatesbacteria bacterium]
MHNHGPLAGAYGLTVVGAIVYFIKNAVGFWGCVVGFLKGCVWPAIVVFKVLELLKA